MVSGSLSPCWVLFGSESLLLLCREAICPAEVSRDGNLNCATNAECRKKLATKRSAQLNPPQLNHSTGDAIRSLALAIGAYFSRLSDETVTLLQPVASPFTLGDSIVLPGESRMIAISPEDSLEDVSRRIPGAFRDLNVLFDGKRVV
jgi:hypothetical protein